METGSTATKLEFRLGRAGCSGDRFSHSTGFKIDFYLRQKEPAGLAGLTSGGDEVKLGLRIFSQRDFEDIVKLSIAVSDRSSESNSQRAANTPAIVAALGSVGAGVLLKLSRKIIHCGHAAFERGGRAKHNTVTPPAAPIR
jgi:hypothetical protein